MKNHNVYTDSKYKIIDEEFRPGQWTVERGSEIYNQAIAMSRDY